VASPDAPERDLKSGTWTERKASLILFYTLTLAPPSRSYSQLVHLPWHTGCSFLPDSAENQTETYMQAKAIYACLVIGGAVAGYIATRPARLQPLRPFQMTLLPLLLCSLFVTVAGLATGTMYTILTVPLLLVAIGALSLTLAPNVVWFFRDRFRESVDNTRKPPLLEDVHMRPIRQLVAQEKFEDACVRLESLLKNYRADFSELQLMTQLYHQVNRNKEAQSCALEMIRAAQEEDEQLTAMRFYHQLAKA